MTLRAFSKRIFGRQLHHNEPALDFRDDEDVRQENGQIRIKLEPSKEHRHRMQLEGEAADENEYLLDIHPIIMVMLLVLLLFTAVITYLISQMPPELP